MATSGIRTQKEPAVYNNSTLAANSKNKKKGTEHVNGSLSPYFTEHQRQKPFFVRQTSNARSCSPALLVPFEVSQI